MVLFFTNVFVSFVLLEVYFKIAERFGIMDKPNERSSQKVVTLKGAGVVFGVMGIIALVATPRYYSPHSSSNHFYPEWPVGLFRWAETLDFGLKGNYDFLVGLLIIAIVSFHYDVRPLPPKVRMKIQFVAPALKR